MIDIKSQTGSGPINRWYSSQAIKDLRQEIATAIVLNLSNARQISPKLEIPRISISEKGVEFDSFSAEDMNSVRTALVLLEMAESIFSLQVQPANTTAFEEMIKIPNGYSLSYDNPLHGDLFGSSPISRWIYCLSKAFHILKWKLEERQTPLFHLLFLKTCLLFEREWVPSGFILWKEYQSLSWFEFVRKFFTYDDIAIAPDGAIKESLDVKIDRSGFEQYPEIHEEFLRLYEELFNNGLFLNRAIR
jgi:hypothetical protein